MFQFKCNNLFLSILGVWTDRPENFWRLARIQTYLGSLFIIFFSAFSINATANPIKKAHVEAELIADVKSVSPGQAFWAGVRMKIDPKWHTYWKNPGDAGLATKIDWTLPEGLHAGPIQWPYPQRFNDSGIISQGYKDEVILLSKIDVAPSVAVNQLLQLKAQVRWLVCKEICLPGDADLELELMVAEGTSEIDSRWTRKISDARSKIPLENSEWRFVANLDANNTLEVLAIAPEPLTNGIGNVVFFPDKGIPIKLNRQQTWEDIGQKEFRLTLELLPPFGDLPQYLRGVMVREGGWRGLNSEKALRIHIPVTSSTTIQSPQVSTRVPSAPGILLAFVFAFVGGLILNLMPCVFPVISLKVLGFVSQAHEGSTKVWRHGLVFTLGVLISFWILAGILLLVRAGGEQVGWGFQLQSPIFVMSLAVLMFLLALNLFGVYEIGLSLTRTGSVLIGKSGWSESFLSGVLATIIATPCTAPFMGAALGFALSQPAITSIGIFTFLGLGMAFPYLLLSRFHNLIKFIPKPGPWMESFKQLMGFLLMGSVVWLLWLLQILGGPQATIALIAGFVVIALGTWIYGKWGYSSRKLATRIAAIAFAVVCLIVGIMYPVNQLLTTERSTDTVASTAKEANGIPWEGFTSEKVERLRSEGKRVFVDFTAAWCLSCLANERVAFSSKAVQDRFKELNVIPIKADWTHRNEEITRELEKFGRSGVPFYVLYDGNMASEPIILPEILTPGIVLDALDKLEKTDEDISARNI